MILKLNMNNVLSTLQLVSHIAVIEVLICIDLLSYYDNILYFKGLRHLSRMHKFDDLLPGSLEFRGPYGTSG